jgi:hypothetical protein
MRSMEARAPDRAVVGIDGAEELGTVTGRLDPDTGPVAPCLRDTRLSKPTRPPHYVIRNYA